MTTPSPTLPIEQPRKTNMEMNDDVANAILAARNFGTPTFHK